MSLSRLRAGELLALAGSIALFVLMFSTWAAPEDTLIRSPGAEIPAGATSAADGVVNNFVGRYAESGWTTLGWFMVLLLVLNPTQYADLAQTAILQEYINVYCLQPEQARKDPAKFSALGALMSRLTIRANLGSVALLEYAKCKVLKGGPGQDDAGLCEGISGYRVRIYSSAAATETFTP